jgi:hypothetical protein
MSVSKVAKVANLVMVASSLARILICFSASILGLLLVCTKTFAQASTPATAIDAAGPHLFTGNPAVVPTKGTTVGTMAHRDTKESEMKFDRDGGETRRTNRKDDMFGLAALADMGAGAALGVNVTQTWAELNSSSTNGNARPRELFATQTLAGRLLIDLTPDVRAGLFMRHQSQEARVTGNFNTEESIVYKGSLMGYSAGLAAQVNSQFGLAAQWTPPMRGKSNIIGEERLLSEPGLAGLAVQGGPDDRRWGAYWHRWIHKRDDRADNTSTGGANNRPIVLSGMDFDSFLFPVWQLGLGGDMSVRPNLALGLTLVREQGEFIFNADQVPGDNPDGQRVSFWRVRSTIRLTNGKVNVTAGLGLWQREASLSGAQAGSWRGSGREVSIGVAGTM